MRGFLSEVPGFLPGVAASLVIALLAAGRVATTLRANRLLAFCLVVSIGAILAATLTPNAGSLEPPPGTTFCDLSRVSAAPLADLLSLHGEPSLNALLCLPLGLVIGLLPRSAGKIVLLAGALALPAVIEVLQGLLTLLNRSCSSADVVDNLTGLAVGVVLGSAAGWLWVRVTRTAG